MPTDEEAYEQIQEENQQQMLDDLEEIYCNTDDSQYDGSAGGSCNSGSGGEKSS